MTSSPVSIVKWTDLAGAAPPVWLTSGIAAVFREAAARWPSDAAAAAAFTELWLDSYLRHDPDLAFVALTPATPPRVVGYLVATTADPLTDPRFAPLGYFRDFAPELAAFPAHLHLNVAADSRNQRIGERLVETVCTVLAARGCPGIHIVTGAAARNIDFYRRCGFARRAEAVWNGHARVLMGRRLQT